MMWWNDVGAVWGWGGCLLVLFLLVAFWGAVIAAVLALFKTARPTIGPADHPSNGLGNRPVTADFTGDGGPTPAQEAR